MSDFHWQSLREYYRAYLPGGGGGEWSPIIGAPEGTGIYVVSPDSCLSRHGVQVNANGVSQSRLENGSPGQPLMGRDGEPFVRFFWSSVDAATTHTLAFRCGLDGSHGWRVQMRSGVRPRLRIYDTGAVAREVTHSTGIATGYGLIVFGYDGTYPFVSCNGGPIERGPDPCGVYQDTTVGSLLTLGAWTGAASTTKYQLAGGINDIPGDAMDAFCAWLWNEGNGRTHEEIVDYSVGKEHWVFPLDLPGTDVTQTSEGLAYTLAPAAGNVDPVNGVAGHVYDQARLGTEIEAIEDIMGNYPNLTARGTVPILQQDVNGYFVQGNGVDTDYRGGSFGPGGEVIAVGTMPANNTMLIAGGQTQFRLVSRIFGGEWYLRWGGAGITHSTGDSGEHVFTALADPAGWLRVDGTEVVSGDIGAGSNVFHIFSFGTGGFSSGIIRYMQFLPGEANPSEYREKVEAWLKAEYGTP